MKRPALMIVALLSALEAASDSLEKFPKDLPPAALRTAMAVREASLTKSERESLRKLWQDDRFLAGITTLQYQFRSGVTKATDATHLSHLETPLDNVSRKVARGTMTRQHMAFLVTQRETLGRAANVLLQTDLPSLAADDLQPEALRARLDRIVKKEFVEQLSTPEGLAAVAELVRCACTNKRPVELSTAALIASLTDEVVPAITRFEASIADLTARAEELHTAAASTVRRVDQALTANKREIQRIVQHAPVADSERTAYLTSKLEPLLSVQRDLHAAETIVHAALNTSELPADLRRLLPPNLDTALRTDISQLLEIPDKLDQAISAMASPENLSNLQGAAIAMGVPAIAQHLGVDPAITSVATSILTGNYASAVGVLAGGLGIDLGPLGGLLGGGGGGVDLGPVMAQLAEIRRALEQISAKLDVIDKKIDDLTQLTIKLHQETMARLADISFEIEVLRKTQLGAYQRQAAACDVLKQVDGLPYEEIERVVTGKIFTQYEKCENLLVEQAANENLDPAFLLPTTQQASQSKRRYFENYVRPHFLLLQSVFSLDERPRAVSALARSTQSIESVRTAARLDDTTLTPTLRGVFDASEHLLDTATISDFVGRLDRIQRLTRFINRNKRWMVTKECAIDAGCLGKEKAANEHYELDLLRNSVRLVDTALAQQALFSGTILLPSARKILLQGSSDDRADLQAVYSHGDTFARNLVAYVIDDTVVGDRPSPQPATHQDRRLCDGAQAVVYAFASSSAFGATYLQSLAPNDRSGITFIQKTADVSSVPTTARDTVVSQVDAKAICGRELAEVVYARLPGDVCVPIPTPMHFATRQLAMTPEWTTVAQHRARLQADIAAYDFTRGLTEGGRRDYLLAFLAAAVQENPASTATTPAPTTPPADAKRVATPKKKRT